MENINIEFSRWDGVNEDYPEKEYLFVYLNIGGVLVGELKIDEEDGHIEFVEIQPDFKGKGFYKMLLLAGLQEVPELYSDDRNVFSNPAYKHWTNDNLLSCEDTVYIEIENESLKFQIGKY